MAIKISLFITLVLYAMVISQSFFYALALSKVIKKMQVEVYIETRNLLTQELKTNLKLLYYFAIAGAISLTTFSVVNPGGWLFISSVIALAALTVDVLLAVKGNVPLNNAIDTWTPSSYPSNWEQYRTKWFVLYHIRQIINVVGFIVLLAGIVFGI